MDDMGLQQRLKRNMQQPTKISTKQRKFRVLGATSLDLMGQEEAANKGNRKQREENWRENATKTSAIEKM